MGNQPGQHGEHGEHAEHAEHSEHGQQHPHEPASRETGAPEVHWRHSLGGRANSLPGSLADTGPLGPTEDPERAGQAGEAKALAAASSLRSAPIMRLPTGSTGDLQRSLVVVSAPPTDTPDARDAAHAPIYVRTKPLLPAPEVAIPTPPAISPSAGMRGGHRAVQETVDDLAGQIAVSSQRIYGLDITRFLRWLDTQGVALSSVDRRVIITYRADLAAHYQKATAARHLSIVRRFLAEAVLHGVLSENPATSVRGFRKVGADETPHQALDREQLRRLLAAVEARLRPNATPSTTGAPPKRGRTRTLIEAEAAEAAEPERPLAGSREHTTRPRVTATIQATLQWTVQLRRDLALLTLLARTGLRRAEASQLDCEDLQDRQGHAILLVRHGKGDQRRVIKVPVDVRRLLEEYLASVGPVETLFPDGRIERPLFVACKRNGRPRVVGLADQRTQPCEGHVRLTGGAIEDLVKRYGRCLDTHLTPHDLRATFITLALEGGAKLEQVQYAVGHADPRTTEHYQRRKLNLDDNAVDYIRL